MCLNKKSELVIFQAVEYDVLFGVLHYSISY